MAITFRAKLWAPMEGKGWAFVTMPKSASAQLPARGRVAIEGAVNGFKFRSSAFPDGDGSHNIQVNSTIREGAKVAVGQSAEFSISPSTDAVKVTVPTDLSAALKKSAKASKAMGFDYAQGSRGVGCLDYFGEEGRDAGGTNRQNN
jgi:hypothetical protein